MQKNLNKLKRDLKKYKFTFNQMVPNRKRRYIPIIPLPQNYTPVFWQLTPSFRSLLEPVLGPWTLKWGQP